MAFSNNPMFSPDNLLMLSGNILAAPNFAQGLGTGLSQLGANVAAQKKEQEERQRQLQETAQMGNYLRQQAPGQDFSNFTPGMMKLAASSALDKQINPAKPEFKVLDDGTYGTWDGTQFKALGKASKRDEMPAAYRDFQMQQQDPAYAEHVRSTSKTGQTFEERKRIAQELGITEDDERYQPYIATGKFPREDQQRMTAGDKAQLYELQDKIDANKTVIANMESLLAPDESGKSLNDRAGSGWTAGWQALFARNDPTGMMDNEQGEATTEFNNVITQNTLGQLKSVFGGNPTEGERAVLREMEASVDKSPTERKIIIQRAIALAQRRLGDSENRRASILDESFYKPGGMQQPATSVDSLVEQYRSKGK